MTPGPGLRGTGELELYMQAVDCVDCTHCFKNKLNLRTKSEPVTTGLDATVYVHTLSGFCIRTYSTIYICPEILHLQLHLLQP